MPIGARPLVLGRAPDCDVVIEEPFVSGHHALIESDGDGYVLKDAGSTNGTLLDGRPVNGGTRLANGSVVILGQPGNYRLRFLSQGAPGSATGANRNLQEVLEISKVLLSTLDLEEVLGRVLDACLRIARAERGYLFLREGGDLKLRASRDGGPGGATQQQVEFSRSIASRVAESGQPDYLSGLDEESCRDKSASIARLHLQTIACVPLKIQQRVIGIVYLDSSRPSVLPDATGREVLEVLAGLAAVAIENARLILKRVDNERWTAIGRMAASIVHDIRTPLAAMRGTAELLERRLTEPEHKAKLNAIIGEVDRLSRLSSEMLEFSTKAQPLQATTGSLTQLVREFLAAVEPRLAQEQIRLETRLGFGGRLALDRQKIARLLHNVVGNALEAMSPGGTLTVESMARDTRAVLAISDTGCGMDPETAARVFEPFFSHGKAHGTGLGMAVVRQIAEQHGATISIESAPGEGTRVEFRFPLPAAPDPPR